MVREPLPAPHILETPERRPRVAMFVLNPAHSDARVRREAATLGRVGYEVRIYALGNSTWPEGVVGEDGFEIHRVEVVSVYQRLLERLRTWWAGLSRLPEVVARARPRAAWQWVALAPVLPLGALLRYAERARAERADPTLPLREGTWYRKLGRHAWLWTRRAWRLVRRGLRRLYLWGYRAARRLLLPLHRPSVIRQFWVRAGEAAAGWGPDVVHAHDLNTLPAALRAAGERTRVVYDSHELWRKRNRHGQLRPLGRTVDWWLERRLIGRADLVITVSPGISDWLAREYRLRPPLVLRNLPEAWEPTVSGLSVRELAGLDEDRRLLLYTGRITSGRGLGPAIRSLAMLPEDIHLVLLGYGDFLYIEELVRSGEREGVADRLHVIGPVAHQEVPSAASSADVALVYIEPTNLSYRLSLPNKLFEAIQGRVPVVATDLPEIRGVVLEYGIGELFSPGDPRGLAVAVERVLAARAVYGEGLERAARELVWEREAKRLVESYRGLVGGRAETSRRP